MHTSDGRPLNARIKVFDLVREPDCLKFTRDFTDICDDLGLTEWHPGVWLGRFFARDNDFGEHWFDNWDERARLEEKLDVDCHGMMIVVPSRFSDGKDGPCHDDETRRRFWVDVLSNLTLGFEVIADEARFCNDNLDALDRILDLEERIFRWRRRIGERQEG